VIDDHPLATRIDDDRRYRGGAAAAAPHVLATDAVRPQLGDDHLRRGIVTDARREHRLAAKPRDGDGGSRGRATAHALEAGRAIFSPRSGSTGTVKTKSCTAWPTQSTVVIAARESVRTA